MRAVCVPLEKIQIHSTRRALDLDHVAALARSIEAIGLIQRPILNESYELLAGAHRVEAARVLGWEAIDCDIADADELDAELIEIDENVVRKKLDRPHELKAMARRKELYEAKHPETKWGANLSELPRQGGRYQSVQNGHSGNSEQRPSPFTRETMQQTSKARGTVDRDVRVGSSFTLEELERMDAAKIPILAQDKLASVRKSEPALVSSLMTLPVEEMRDRAATVVDLQTEKRGPRSLKAHQPTPTSSRSAAKKREAKVRTNAEAQPPPRQSTTPICQTEKYSVLGAHDEKAASRTLQIGSNPADAARLLADHFDREGMEALFYCLLRYLSPRTVKYVLKTYGKDTSDDRTVYAHSVT